MAIALPFRVCAIAIALGVFGCASVSTRLQENPAAPVSDGVIYYMPKQPIKISIAIDDKGVVTPSATSGDIVPDLSHRFVLDYQQNWLGTNKLVAGVNTMGLLTSSNATTTSGVGTILQNLATFAGQISVLETKPGQTPIPCKAGQTYYLIAFPEDLKATVPTGSRSICGFNVTAEPLFPSGIGTPGADTQRLHTGGSESGIFYKQQLPYKVQITSSDGLSSSFLVYSPDEAPIGFIPVNRTFFADNGTNVTLQNGILTQVDENTTGEILALSQYPSQIINAYFKAIGGLFSQIGTNTTSQTSVINDQTALAAAKAKQQYCTATIAANPLSGKSGTELSNAEAAIKAACN